MQGDSCLSQLQMMPPTSVQIHGLHLGHVGARLHVLCHAEVMGIRCEPRGVVIDVGHGYRHGDLAGEAPSVLCLHCELKRLPLLTVQGQESFQLTFKTESKTLLTFTLKYLNKSSNTGQWKTVQKTSSAQIELHFT